MTTNQSASLAVRGEVKRDHRHMEPKAPLNRSSVKQALAVRDGLAVRKPQR